MRNILLSAEHRIFFVWLFFLVAFCLLHKKYHSFQCTQYIYFENTILNYFMVEHINQDRTKCFVLFAYLCALMANITSPMKFASKFDIRLFFRILILCVCALARFFSASFGPFFQIVCCYFCMLFSSN